MSRSRTSLVGLTFGLAFLASTPAFDTGCGTTGSRRYAFQASAAGVERDASAPFVFENARGWTITLTKANVTIGPIYLNVAPAIAGTTAWWHKAPLGIRSAKADDSHLADGRQVGEVLARLTVDALSPSLVPFAGAGTIVEEQVRTTEIWLWPPPQITPETVKIDDPTLDVAGEATRGADRVRFRGTLVLDEAWTTDAQPGERSAQPVSDLRKVRGVPSVFVPSEGGELRIRIDPRPLFRGAEFTNLASSPADADGTKILVQSKSGKFTTDQVMRNLYQGLRAATGTYDVRWVP